MVWELCLWGRGLSQRQYWYSAFISNNQFDTSRERPEYSNSSMFTYAGMAYDYCRMGVRSLLQFPLTFLSPGTLGTDLCRKNI